MHHTLNSETEYTFWKSGKRVTNPILSYKHGSKFYRFPFARPTNVFILTDDPNTTSGWDEVLTGGTVKLVDVTLDITQSESGIKAGTINSMDDPQEILVNNIGGLNIFSRKDHEHTHEVHLKEPSYNQGDKDTVESLVSELDALFEKRDEILDQIARKREKLRSKL